MNTMPPTTEMRRAYLERDASYDGLFFLGARTDRDFLAGRHVRAWKLLPRNVEYFPSAQSALMAGFRPCKRCRPLESDDQPSWAAGLLADVEPRPFGHAHLRRRPGRQRGRPGYRPTLLPMRRYGMTFQAFTKGEVPLIRGRSTRSGKMGALDAAGFESGYESQSGFRDAFMRTFGDTPGSYRGGECVFLSWLRSPLGPLVAGATATGFCLLEFTDRRMLEAQFATVQKLFGAPVVPGSNEHLQTLEVELARYFAGSLKNFSVPLTCPGTAFQRQVWEQLLAIPYGQTRS